MRPTTLLFALSLSTLAFAACTASSPASESGHNEELVRPSAPNADIIGGLAFNIWTCKDLECLNLETNESSMHTYTACAAVLEDAQNVGLSFCEAQSPNQKKRTTIRAHDATCEPTGQPCPDQRRGAYNWDDFRRNDSTSDAGFDSSAPATDGGS